MSLRNRWNSFPGWRFALIALSTVAVTTYVALSQRRAVARCPEGLQQQGPRCCPQGQELRGAQCVGTAEACSSAQVLTGNACLPAEPDMVDIQAGRLKLAPNDWEAEGRVEALDITVASFRLHRTEVTHAQWAVCVQHGKCPALPSREANLPVTDIGPEQAERYCQSVGGRLPTHHEWLFAATGSEGRRYPWGQTGLVCRRAVFGLVQGPCATGAQGPDGAGSRPDGATPDGLLDMAGNVAEWSRAEATNSNPPTRLFEARGGSFRSRLARELKVWAVDPDPRPSDFIGFRCAFDAH